MSDKTSDKRLLPCPFCGGEAELNLFLGNYCVTCTECMGAIFPAKGMTKEEAIQAWNTRKPVDAVLEHLEEEKQNALKLWDNNSRYMGYEHSIKIVKENLT